MFFGHLQPVPPSPAAARKISFNGLKETIVLPQQAGTFNKWKVLSSPCPEQ